MIMRKFFLAGVLALAVPLGGCATIGTIGEAPLAGTIKDEKALYVAEAAFDGISAVIEAGVDGGLITGSTAGQVQTYYRQARTALLAARTAQQAGDSGTLLEQSIVVQELVAKIFGLLK